MNAGIFMLNVVHRPELTPEYAEKTGGTEAVGKSLDIFVLQQEIAHRNGIRTTMQMTYASLFNEEAVALALEHHKLFGNSGMRSR